MEWTAGNIRMEEGKKRKCQDCYQMMVWKFLEIFSTLEEFVEESCRLKYNDNECVKSASFSFSCRTTDGMIVVSGDNDLN